MTSAKELGELLGITARHVTRLAADGVLHRDGDGFDVKRSVRAYCDWLRRDEETRVQKRKLLVAQTEATRVRSTRAVGGLLSRAEVIERLRRFEHRLWGLRVTTQWHATRLDPIVGREKSSELASEQHRELAALIAEARDYLFAQFPAPPTDEGAALN